MMKKGRGEYNDIQRRKTRNVWEINSDKALVPVPQTTMAPSHP